MNTQALKAFVGQIYKGKEVIDAQYFPSLDLVVLALKRDDVFKFELRSLPRAEAEHILVANAKSA